MRRVEGFSLLELLVVTAIVSLVAAAAIPAFLTSRLSANEEAARQACREIAAAEAAQARTHQGRFADLGELRAENRFGKVLAGNDLAADYRFESDTGGPPGSFRIIAVPVSGHGRYIYSVSQDAIVRNKAAAPGFALPEGVNPGDPAGP
jgi:prepilin-type N-terminal cleavage/methylation domain-containing protein